MSQLLEQPQAVVRTPPSQPQPPAVTKEAFIDGMTRRRSILGSDWLGEHPYDQPYELRVICQKSR